MTAEPAPEHWIRPHSDHPAYDTLVTGFRPTCTARPSVFD